MMGKRQNIPMNGIRKFGDLIITTGEKKKKTTTILKIFQVTNTINEVKTGDSTS